MMSTHPPLSAPAPQAITRHCFALAAQHNASLHTKQALPSALLPIDCSPLSPLQCQDLANALPFLACGEESAVHAFGSSLLKQVSDAEQKAMIAIAQDELRHAQWLEQLRVALPPPDIPIPAQAMLTFFRHLLTRDTAKHFARVAALDSAVCHILAPLLHPKSSLQIAPSLHSGLSSIVRDEARHVNIARQMARKLGMTQQTQAQINLDIQQTLNILLSPIVPGLHRLYARDENLP